MKPSLLSTNVGFIDMRCNTIALSSLLLVIPPKVGEGPNSIHISLEAQSRTLACGVQSRIYVYGSKRHAPANTLPRIVSFVHTLHNIIM